MTRVEPSSWSNSGAGLLEIPGVWVEEALCAQIDPEMFFPDKGGNARAAKRICEQCTVRAECLAFALDHDERFGIWGGVSERDRRELKKQRTTTTKEDTMTTTPDEVDDFEVCEDCYASVDPSDVDENGRCSECHMKAEVSPAPPEPVKVVDRPTLPGYAYDAAALLAATEGHHDPLVRDVRKIAAQALQALHVAKEQYDRLAAVTGRAVAAFHSIEAATEKKTTRKKAGAKTAGKRDPLATTTVMKQHGVTPAQVRAWAEESGVPVAARGNPSMDVIEQYLTATTSKEN